MRPDDDRRSRRAVLGAGLATGLSACAPTVQLIGAPLSGTNRPRFEGDRFVSYDGTPLGLSTWAAEGEPWAVIIGLHGMNSYARAFRQAGPFWAGQGITTYAYDQRGFGRSPHRGVWASDDAFTEDLSTACIVARARHPGALIAIAGESMGGAVAIQAFASDRPPAADRLLLLSPAVWGWSSQPLPYSTSLWVAAHVIPDRVLTPPRMVTRRIFASDNIDELVDMGRDRLMIWGARTDALFGLVGLMERAWRNTGRLPRDVLYLYGAHDQIIPAGPARQAAGRMPAGARSAYYADGYHLLLVDRQAERVWRDVASFVRDPQAPLPSGVPPFRRRAGASRTPSS